MLKNNKQMDIKLYFLFTVILLVSLLANTAVAQSTRGLINDGVDLYGEGKYPDAEVKFKKGLENDFDTFEGHFNLGDSYYKQGRFDEALQAYKNALALTEDDYKKSKVFHNVGNALLKSQKIKESIEAYKNSLKLDPNDLETKYNLSYALNMLKNQQDQQQQNQNNDQNQDQNKDNQQQQQNQDQQEENQEQKQNQQNQQQDEQQQKQEQQQQQAQPKDQISKEEAQRILEALKNNEAELQKELRKRKGKPVKTEKDW